MLLRGISMALTMRLRTDWYEEVIQEKASGICKRSKRARKRTIHPAISSKVTVLLCHTAYNTLVAYTMSIRMPSVKHCIVSFH